MIIAIDARRNLRLFSNTKKLLRGWVLMKKVPCSASDGCILAVKCASGALASPVTLTDNYFGGTSTHNNADSIGDGIFNIDTAQIQRTGSGKYPLQVVINTAFAGHAGQDAGWV